MCWRAIVAGLIALGLAEPVPAEPLRVQGTVRDAAGAALAKARVELTPMLPNHTWNRLLLDGVTAVPAVATAATNAAGRFALTVPSPGIWRVEVKAEGFVPMRLFPLPVVAPVELPPVSLVKDAGARIQVIDGSGAAVAGAWVAADSGTRSAWSRWTVDGWTVAYRLGRSDGTGTVILPRMEGESLVVTARRPGSLASSQGRGEGTARLVLQAKGGTREVEVQGDQGEPLEGVVVVAGEPALPLGRTDAKGRLTVHGIGKERVFLHLFARDGQRRREPLPAGAPAGTGALRFVLSAPAWIDGRVVDAASRKPLAGALVWAGHDPGLSATAGADGRYRIVAPPDDRFWVQAEAGGFLPENRWVSAAEARAGKGPLLALPSAVEVEGRVVDEAGAPLAGVQVEAVAASRPPTQAFHPDRAESRSTTGADGRFRLAALHPEGSFAVTAVQRGFLPARKLLGGLQLPDGRAPVRLVLLRSRSAFGRVVDRQDRPLPEVEVKLSPGGPAAGGGEAVTARTDGEGKFMVAEIPALELDLEARKEGFGPRTVRGVEVPPGRGPVDLGTLVLTPGAVVAGAVRDRGGRPVAGASVWLEEDRGGAPPGLRRVLRGEPAATTGEDGRFRVADLEPGRRIHLAARKEGFVPAMVRGVEAPTREPVSLVLDPASRVSGLVVTGEGQPVAGAQVELAGAEPPPGVAGVPRRSSDDSRSAVTEADGRFTLDEVAPGAFEVRATAEGYQPAKPVALEVVSGKPVEGVRLVLAPGATLEGLITDRGGHPVPGTRVTAGPSAAMADADGRYRATGIPPGPRTVEVRHPAYNRLSRRLEIEPGTQQQDFVLDGGRSVAGRVVDEAGEAVAEARLQLQLREARDLRDYTVLAGAKGRFRFSAVADGVYELRAEREGYAPAEIPGVKVDGQPVEDLTVVLRRGGTIRGRLLGLELDELAAAQVEAVQGESGSRSGTVDHRGHYEVADLAPGDWLVRARVQGRSRQAEARVTLDPEDRQATRDLEFSGGLTLSGQIFYGEQPLPEAQVSATGFEAALQRSVTADPAGRFRLEGLEPGSYRVSVSSPRELLTYNELVELTGDTDLRIDIPTARVSGIVVSAATAQPVPGAVVYLQQLVGAQADQPASIVNVVTDARGSFLLARVTAGRHQLRVRKDGYAPAEQMIEAQPGADVAGLEIPLTPTEGLDLQARFASGTVPPFVAVGVLDPAGRLVSAEGGRPDAEGWAHIGNVPTGSWQLWVSAAGGVAVKVPATVPGPPVRVVLPVAGRLRVRVPSLVERNLVARLILLNPTGQVFEDLDAFGVLRQEWHLIGGSGTVDGLPPGPWTVRVTAPDGQAWETAVVVAPGVEADVQLP